MATVRDGSAFFKRTSRVESFEEGQAVSVRENRIVSILDVSDLEVSRNGVDSVAYEFPVKPAAQASSEATPQENTCPRSKSHDLTY